MLSSSCIRPKPDDGESAGSWPRCIPVVDRSIAPVPGGRSGEGKSAEAGMPDSFPVGSCSGITELLEYVNKVLLAVDTIRGLRIDDCDGEAMDRQGDSVKSGESLTLIFDGDSSGTRGRG